ncbi:MAG: ParA family protein [Thermodesulfovibrionales bacterium]
MARILTIVNQKGGVGKTTTAINLGASLALAERDILVIDTDPQGNLTSGLGINRGDIKKSLYDIYIERSYLKDVIIPTQINHLFVAPSTVDLLGVEVELVGKDGREFILSKAIAELKEQYQYILIDCPPSLGLLTLNALVAAHGVIIPVQCEYYAVEGLSLLMQTLRMVRSSFNPALEIEGIVLTMFDSRNALSHQVEAEVRKHFSDLVYETVIPRNVALAEAPSHGKPVLLYDIKSKGAQSYIELAKEILNEDSVRKRN